MTELENLLCGRKVVVLGNWSSRGNLSSDLAPHRIIALNDEKSLLGERQVEIALLDPAFGERSARVTVLSALSHALVEHGLVLVEGRARRASSPLADPLVWSIVSMKGFEFISEKELEPGVFYRIFRKVTPPKQGLTSKIRRKGSRAWSRIKRALDRSRA